MCIHVHGLFFLFKDWSRGLVRTGSIVNRLFKGLS